MKYPGKPLILAFYICLLIVTFAFPVEIAKYGGEFMSIGVGSRALAMGGSYVAVGGDVTHSYWNPAGLAFINYPEISAMHSRSFGGVVNYDYAGVATPIGAKSSFGMTLTRVAVDDIPYTALPRPDLNIDAAYTDENGKTIANRPYVERYVNDAEYALYLSYARQRNSAFSYGANVKLIRKGVGDNSAWGVGFDFGALWNVFDNLNYGINFQDMTTTVLAWDTGRRELISPTIKTGFASPLYFSSLKLKFLLTSDVDVRLENRRTASNFHYGRMSADYHVGGEVRLRDLVALRVGSDWGNFTAGAGIKLPRLEIDYAFLSHPELEVTHRVSLRLILEEDQFARK